MRSLLALSLVGCTSVSAPNPLDDATLIRVVAELTADQSVEGDGFDDSSSVRALMHAIEAGGASLNSAAGRALRDDDADRRLRAELVLQVLPQTERTMTRLAASDDPREWAWAALAQAGYPALRTPRDQSRSCADSKARQVLNRFAGSLKQALTLTEEELSPLKDAYVESYREQLLPNLEHPGNHVSDLMARTVDLTGDGHAEQCLVGILDDGWSGTPFLLIVDVVGDRCCRVENLSEFGRVVSLEAYDIDADDKLELVVSGQVIGGWVWDRMRAYDLDHSAYREWTDRQVIALESPTTKQVWFASGDAFNASGGKAEYLDRAVGSAFNLERLAADGSVAQTLTVHTGVRLW